MAVTVGGGGVRATPPQQVDQSRRGGPEPAGRTRAGGEDQSRRGGPEPAGRTRAGGEDGGVAGVRNHGGRAASCQGSTLWSTCPDGGDCRGWRCEGDATPAGGPEPAGWTRAQQVDQSPASGPGPSRRPESRWSP